MNNEEKILTILEQMRGDIEQVKEQQQANSEQLTANTEQLQVHTSSILKLENNMTHELKLLNENFTGCNLQK